VIWRKLSEAILVVFIVYCPHSYGQKTSPIRVHLQLSVDWEGDTLRPRNLKAMQRFNRIFPNYPVIHFLNAAYYTKSNFLPAAEITRRVRSVLKTHDELGLHIHSWENLVRAAGVIFRPGPSFWAQSESLGRGGEKGDDVPLNEYTAEEIFKIVRFSLELLESHGFTDIQSFRGGGWMSGPKVFEALIKAGILIDSSAVPPELVENLYPKSRLAELNRAQWSHIDVLSRPHVQAGTKSQLIQFPNNAGLADYVTAQEFFDTYLKLVTQARRQGRSEVYLHFGWHQESAVEYFEHQEEGGQKLLEEHFLRRVEEGLRKIERHARQYGIEIKPMGFKDFPKSSVQGVFSPARRCLRRATRR
jgi:hypothetical protein